MATQLKSSAKDLYEQGYYAWTVAQAAELQRLAKRRTSTALDLEHLAEEVADWGHSERDAVRSQMRRIIEHLLKLEYSPATDPRDGWKDTTADARSAVADKLSPSLRLDLEVMLPLRARRPRPSGMVPPEPARHRGRGSRLALRTRRHRPEARRRPAAVSRRSRRRCR